MAVSLQNTPSSNSKDVSAPDSRIGRRRGNLLLVGPHRTYTDYVADVLPALGEHSVQTATIADLAGANFAGGDLVPRVSELPDESNAQVAAPKSGLTMVRAIGAAVRS